jgi:hypothetical protein
MEDETACPVLARGLQPSNTPDNISADADMQNSGLVPWDQGDKRTSLLTEDPSA